MTARGLSQEFRKAAVSTLFRPISSAAQFTTCKLSHENSPQMCAFILHSFWKVLFLVIIASPENAIISGPRRRQQTLMHTANIKSLVAREQKHSDYLDSTSKSFLWKFSGTWWQMSPVFYHQNSPASQNKLLKGSRCLSTNVV